MPQLRRKEPNLTAMNGNRKAQGLSVAPALVFGNVKGLLSCAIYRDERLKSSDFRVFYYLQNQIYML